MERQEERDCSRLAVECVVYSEGVEIQRRIVRRGGQRVVMTWQIDWGMKKLGKSRKRVLGRSGAAHESQWGIQGC